MFRQMGQHCMDDPDYYTNMIKAGGDHDVYLAAKDAIKHGLATHLGTPKFRTSVTVQTVMEYPDNKYQKQRLKTICGHNKANDTKFKKRKNIASDEEGDEEKHDEDDCSDNEELKTKSKNKQKGKKKRKRNSSK